MNENLPPPPPSNPTHRPDGKGQKRPTYWLYTADKGMEGPYTKKEARQIVVQEPGTSFLACREGEDWQDAVVRLPEEKKSLPWRFIIMLILVAAVGFGSWRWYQTMEAERKAKQHATPVGAGQ